MAFLAALAEGGAAEGAAAEGGGLFGKAKNAAGLFGSSSSGSQGSSVNSSKQFLGPNDGYDVSTARPA